MATKQVSARWTGAGLHYIGTDSKGNNISMGGDHTVPGELLLISAAGCMGMDVVSVLQKKRQAVTGIEIQVTGHQPDDYPQPFQIVELAFTVKGENVDPHAVERAIELSRDKYCIVGQTLKNVVELKTTYTIENE
ncbi:MAG: OsmC family protein [Anaerolineae bacterium]|nr:OsmC family protein [Anaerolineae bacterium]